MIINTNALRRKPFRAPEIRDKEKQQQHYLRDKYNLEGSIAQLTCTLVFGQSDYEQ